MVNYTITGITPIIIIIPNTIICCGRVGKRAIEIIFE